MKRSYVSLHNHTAFCDGRDSMEDMVRYAIAQNVGAMGFSGHSYIPFNEAYCMSVEGMRAYRAELMRLRGVYGGRIRLYCGIEQEYYATDAPEGYDFVIGSAHFIRRGGEYLEIDADAKTVRGNVRAHFDDDYYAYAAAYFETVARQAQRPWIDCIGHFDLVAKFNEAGDMFCEEDPRYLDPAVAALEALVKSGKVLEMNSGAVSRGYRAQPYPSKTLLKHLARLGGRMTLSADAHAKEHILFLFDEMAELLRECGFQELWTFDGTAFVAEGL